MTDHHAVRQAFDSLLVGALASADRQALTAHLAACPDCGQAWAEFRQVDAMLRGTSGVDPGPDFTAAVMAALPAPKRELADQGCWLLVVTMAAVGLLWWWAGPTAQPGPRLNLLRQTLSAWLPGRHVTIAEIWATLPWRLITQVLYAAAAGWVIAWGTPMLEVARRRVR